MFRWVPYAMVRVALFLVGGILLGIYVPDLFRESDLWKIAGGGIILFCVLATFVRGDWAKTVTGLVGLLCISALGFLNVLLHTDSRQRNHLLQQTEPIAFYKAVITRYAEEKDKSWKVEAQVERVLVSNTWKQAQGNVLLYFSKTDFEQPFHYGDVLVIKDAPQKLTPPGNPGEFDYQRFLSFRKIYHQHFLRKEQVKFVENDPPNRLLDYSIRLRLWADAKIKSVVKGEREKSIASALVLGVTDGLDDDLLRAYASTGAMHVLAVSGLHVGIIYWIILLLLKPLNHSKTGKWLIALISLIVLWSYAFVTGWSPSVLRAVTMFSFMALAKPWGRSTNIYNTLAASICCLLVYEPYMIMSVGFQLSYIAVIGIVYLQPMIYPWWEPQNRILGEIWKISAVSIAAQLATFALGLLYFYQFPNYFLFSNLFVIPVSFVVLVAGLAVLAFSFLNPVILVIGWVLEWSIKIMNYTVFAVESLPYSLIENVYITTFQCWMLMVVTMALILLFDTRKFVFLLVAIVAAMAFSADEWQRLYRDADQARMLVYKVSGHTAVDFIEGDRATFVTDSILWKDADRIRFHIRPNRLRSGVTTVSGNASFFSKTYQGYTLLVWKNQTMVWLTDGKARLPDQLKVDFLIVSKNSVTNWQDVLDRVNCKLVILDSSNSFYFARRSTEALAKKRIPVFSVLDSGAFEYASL